MQNPEMNLRIEMFGNLLQDLRYWDNCLDNGETDDELEYLEIRYDEVLEALRDFKGLLIEELTDYVEHCKKSNTPIDLSYYRIRKELEQFIL